ncbi:19bccc18-3a96-48aa-94f3-c5fd50efb01b [Thermothielavioides terrestris]|uniref:19bccc18-3a96-48aa-94f3-c5fd50efb01b n=1 Tax=Thermothielavioides terrestris TaxID=2587410 RepID=A0A446BLC4_9PEZI|nr:19bccc18-3a96-48aa-94f3-c5fd50efb01b [Thermothielavioides terrestris]
MPYHQGDLAILSAEVYHDGAAFGSPSRLTAISKTQASTSPSERLDDAPRKRARTQAAESAELEAEKKRARGRPRLHTKDETAADRRRTQIRLAQRAYRNRKENAIQTLEKRVQELKDTNEEMSNAFMQLHDFAMSIGLLDKTPEFGRQLRKTTERFLSLARDASDDDAKEGELKGSGASNRIGSRSRSDRARSDSPAHAGSNTAATATTTTPETVDERPKPTWGGLMVSYEPGYTAAIPTSTTTLAQPPVSTSSFGYEVVTHPTVDNASFPFQPAPGGFNIPSGLSPATASPFSLSPSPLPSTALPTPHSHAPLESTFGRRLHRYTQERALVLLSMPSPPPALVSRVFGFCLLMESPATIKRRLLRMLGHDAHQSLHNWSYPFFHLGGAGTHFDAESAATAAGGQRFGNQGTRDVLKPGVTAGFGAGPFSAEVNAVRDGKMDRNMRMALPEFAGEYFDSDETEMYMLQRGVVIPAGADFVPVDVDESLFGGGEGDGEGQAPAPGQDRDGSPATSASSNSSSSSSSSSRSPTSSSGSGAAAGTAAWQNVVDPSLADVFAQADPFAQVASMPGASSAAAFAATASDGDNMLPFGLMPDGSGSDGFGMGAAARSPRRRRLVLDVQTFVEAVCLGRAPGFREKDIKAAFRASVQVGME